MKKILFNSILALILLAAGLAGTTQRAAADQVYHTEHLVLEPVNGAPLRSGFVNNIHPNGPIVFAHEIYQLNGAAPYTTYQVVLMAYLVDSTCSGDADIMIPTAQLVTNKSGNGKAEVVFTPESVEGLHGAVLFIKWQLFNGTTPDYQTICTVVMLD